MWLVSVATTSATAAAMAVAMGAIMSIMAVGTAVMEVMPTVVAIFMAESLRFNGDMHGRLLEVAQSIGERNAGVGI